MADLGNALVDWLAPSTRGHMFFIEPLLVASRRMGGDSAAKFPDLERHGVCLKLLWGRGGGSMKYNSGALLTSKKLKKRKTTAKMVSSASIARRYLELRRLRERVSEIEARGPR
jgi:hypothetical protein